MASPLISISVKHNIGDAIALLDSTYRKQVPFATAKALTKVAQLGQAAVIQAMTTQFDRPTPFTLKSLFIKPATKLSLQAAVYLKDRPAGKNPNSLADLLNQEFAGGGRIRKRLELYLQRAGYISGNEFVAPGAAAKLDQYGNMSSGQIQQILSQLKASPDAGAYSTKSTRSRRNVKKAGEYFWSRGGRLPRGVWLRAGESVRPILLVISTPQYRQRIDMAKIVQKVIDTRFNAEFQAAMDEALRTAR